MRKISVPLIFSNRGFTLTELMISVCVMGFVFSIAGNQVVAVNKLSKQVENRLHAQEESSLLSQYVANEIRRAGGGLLRPYMSISVENNCEERDEMPNCGGSDRVTINVADESFDACPIVSIQNPDKINFAIENVRCCSAALLNQQVGLVKDAKFGFMYVSAFEFNENSKTCSVKIAAGHSYLLNDISPPLNFGDWTGGSLVRVNSKTLFVNPIDKKLVSFTDFNNNRSIENDEVMELSDQVNDLQIILGYDISPQNGNIENKENDQDEWLYNSNGPDEQMGAGGLIAASYLDLRMAGVGVITESFLSRQTSSAQLFDGPERLVNNGQLAAMQTRIYFRSTLIFNN